MIEFSVRLHINLLWNRTRRVSTSVRSDTTTVTVGGLLVDFDGTACRDDVTGELCQRFARGDWARYDEASRDGEMTLRQAIDCQTRLLGASLEEMLDFSLAGYAVDPDFVALVAWAHREGVAIGVVSDGFGFFIEPMLRVAGLTGLPVFANDICRGDDGWHLQHPHGHARCRGCGTCKKRIILDFRARFGPVAFGGDGESDRSAAHYAD